MTKNEAPQLLSEERQIELLREAGCKCKNPLLGYRPKKGPRCRLCNIEAINPSDKGEMDA